MPLKTRTIARSMSADEFAKAIVIPPAALIASNSKLHKSHIYQWTLPALSASVVDKGNGKMVTVATCPAAGACAEACYACQGAYNFKGSMVAHTRKLQFMRDNPEAWHDKIVAEIASKRKLKAFRIHDSGDFMSMHYAIQWFKVCEALPQIGRAHV